MRCSRIGQAYASRPTGTISKTFSTLMRRVSQSASISGPFTARHQSDQTRHIPKPSWMGGVSAVCAGCSTVYANDNKVKKLPFSATAPSACDAAGSRFLGQLTSGEAALHPTGQIIFNYNVIVTLVDRGSPYSSWNMPVKITLRLLDDQGHLLKSFEIYAQTGSGQTKDFPVDKDILSQTASISATMIFTA